MTALRITVRLHGSLAHRGAGSTLTLTLPAGATLDALLAHLPFPSGPVWLAARGDTVLRPEDGLSDGETLDLYPRVGGGGPEPARGGED